MPTPSSSHRISTVLALAAALLSGGVGAWLFQHTDTALRPAAALAFAAAALALIAASLPRAKTPAGPVPVSTPPPTATKPAPAPDPATAPATPALDPVAIADGGALRLLAKLQEQGRLLDFAMEDITSVTDAQVASVARVVHAGCRATLQSAFAPQPLHASAEAATVTVEAGFDPEAHRLLGKVAGSPPFTGTLLHRGWRATTVKLPHATDPSKPHSRIVAPAEIELR